MRSGHIVHRIRLEQPDRERVRVRDLAHELGIHHNTVLEFVRSTGEYVRSHQSYLEAPTAQAVRARFPRPEQPDAPDEAAPPAPAPEPKREGLPPPAPRRKTVNNPFKGQLEAFTPRRTVDLTTLWGVRPAHHRSATPEDDPGDYSPAKAYTASETWRHHEWRIRGIPDADRDVWIAHGIHPNHARIAEGCIAAGLTPGDLSTSVHGFTVLDRISRGEPPGEVARIMRTSRETG